MSTLVLRKKKGKRKINKKKIIYHTSVTKKWTSLVHISNKKNCLGNAQEIKFGVKGKNMARTRRSTRNVIDFWNRNSFFERVSYFLFFMPSQYKFYRDGTLIHLQKKEKEEMLFFRKKESWEIHKTGRKSFFNCVFWKRFRSIYNF